MSHVHLRAAGGGITAEDTSCEREPLNRLLIGSASGSLNDIPPEKNTNPKLLESSLDY